MEDLANNFEISFCGSVYINNLHGLRNKKSQIYENLATVIKKTTDLNLQVKTINHSGSAFVTIRPLNQREVYDPGQS